MGYEHARPRSLELTDGLDMEKKIKHLEFIQGVVNRLATNSFRMKGWSVVLIAALFAFFAREGDNKFVPIGFVPVLFFWGLDGYFLWQERLFRALYDHVRVLDETKVDFSMDIGRFRPSGHASGYSMNTWPRATFSRTLIGFHGVLILTIILAVIFI